ncbi:hypothetical protein CVT24_003293 [Panaeolus cyanescens]|uniref:ubiquitinyl hydrolase 1 n=1 Tax=Panaeolus cyanescens TaxID=181874 RepID=A0A409YRC1_9AGAR|nr:hypothetical protein CVT24_003293 [Panaeolus cyanescens]
MSSEQPQMKWVPLESNPEVCHEICLQIQILNGDASRIGVQLGKNLATNSLNDYLYRFIFLLLQWAKQAGLLTKQSHFEDVYGLDDELLNMVPGPVKAVVLLFPTDDKSDAKRRAEDERIQKEGQPKLDPTIFWMKQKISNACGTIGLIHALANSGVPLSPMGAMHKFLIQTQDKTPDERADILATTPLFAKVHSELSQQGQSAVVADSDLHFTCFVAAPERDLRKVADGEDIGPEARNDTQSSGMRLVELDGRRLGPIDHGECRDLLKDAANVIKQQYLGSSASLQFSVMALTETPLDE